ncbi:hypothetical protein CPB86DRAFT_468188 [Serendipita vermifera]|nr:hypothetical protein CPB86DRAFT_468188 [Serendipita vermifera]
MNTMMHQAHLQWVPDIYLADDLFSEYYTAPVYSLPLEVIAEIAYYVILTTRIPIGRLMLVSTKWHQAIINAPLLWTIIDINVRKSVPTLESCAKYCANCVLRSGELPVDIKLTFSKPKTRLDHVLHDLENEGLFRHYREIYQDSNLPDLPSSASVERSLQETIFRTLIGSKGEVMRRWKSFHYICSSDAKNSTFMSGAKDDLMMSLLDLGWFSHPTPLLESFIVDSPHLIWDFNGPNIRHAYSETSIQNTMPQLPYMPRVQTLRIPVHFNLLSRRET